MCPDPIAPVNGMVTFTGNTVDDTATYSCNTGFDLVGSATAECVQVGLSTAAFSPAPPVCRREYSMNVSKRVFHFLVVSAMHDTFCRKIHSANAYI